MPLVAEKLGLEGHLQAACNGAASPAHALVNAVRSAGGRPTAEDIAAMKAAQLAIDEAAKAAAAAPAEIPTSTGDATEAPKPAKKSKAATA